MFRCKDYSCWEGPAIFEQRLAMGNAVLGALLSLMYIYNFILVELASSLDISEFC